MPEMNMSRAGVGSSPFNPIDAISKKLGRRVQNAAGGAAAAVNQETTMMHQAAEHEHQKWTQVATHVLGEAANEGQHGRNVHFFDAVNKHAEGGTPVSMGFGDTKLDYTRKAAKVRAPKAAPAKQQGPQLVGMPINIATAGTPAAPASPAVAAKTQKYAHRDPVTNKISHYEDTPQVLKPTKKTAKKAAPKKRK